MKVKAPPDGPFVIVDTETTGLHCSEHEILQIAAVAGEIVDDYAAIYWTYNQRVIPESLDSATSHALEVNRYDPVVWEETAVSLYHALPPVIEAIADATFVGYNASFDLGFLRVGAGLEGLTWREPPRIYDVFRELGKPLSNKRGTSAKLVVLCDLLGIGTEEAHDALVDVRMTWRLMWLALKELTGKEVVHEGF